MPTFNLFPQTAIMRGKLVISCDTMHMITTVLLIAPLNVNFATQLQVTKHNTKICHI